MDCSVKTVQKDIIWMNKKVSAQRFLQTVRMWIHREHVPNASTPIIWKMVYASKDQTLLIVRLLTQTTLKIALYATLDISSPIKNNVNKLTYCFAGKLMRMTLKNVWSVLRATE